MLRPCKYFLSIALHVRLIDPLLGNLVFGVGFVALCGGFFNPDSPSNVDAPAKSPYSPDLALLTKKQNPMIRRGYESVIS